MVTIERFAHRHQFTTRTPAAEARADLGGIPKPQVRQFSPDDVTALLRAVADRPKHGQLQVHALNNVYVNIAVFCGLRFGEISALRLVDVNFGKRMIAVRGSYSRFDGLKTPKTKAGVRDVPMPVHVSAMLRDYVERFYVQNAAQLIFLGTSKTPPLAATFNGNHWRPLLKRAGLLGDGRDALHFHALRHFAASWMVEFLPLTDVAQIMGHSTFDMTLRVYAHPIVGGYRRHEAVQGLAERLIAAPVQATEIGEAHCG